MLQSRQVTMRFTDLQKLWTFAQSLQVRSMEINPAKGLLICECKGMDVERAQENYGAEVIENILLVRQ